MNAACSTFEVGLLARSEVKRFEHDSQQLARREPLIAWFVELPVNILAGWVSSRVDRQSDKLAAGAFWFRGARDAVTEHAGLEPLDPEFRLVDRLARMEDDLEHIHESTERLANKLGAMPGNSARQRLRRSLSRMAHRAELLREVVREFRAAVMAYEANRGVTVDEQGAPSEDSFESHSRKLLRAA